MGAVLIVKTMCARDCPDGCFMDAHVEEGRLVSVTGGRDNPVTRGFVCPRGAGDPRRVYSPERVLHPMVRAVPKPGRGFRQAAWDEALHLISSKLRRVLDDHGPESVLLLDYSGNTGLLASQLSLRLWTALGATRTDYAVCSRSGHEALRLHYGLSYGLQPEEIKEKKMIVFWGLNAKVSSVHQWALASEARKENGALIAVVDPRRSDSAESADIWLSPRQGSDAALAYGVACHLIKNNLIDDVFIGSWTKGFDAYKEEALRWTPDLVEEATEVPWENVEGFAKAIGGRRPVAFMMGIGLQKNARGAESIRAVSLLPALLGCHRGFYYTNSRGRYVDFGYLTGESPTSKLSRVVSQVAVGERLEAGEFRFVYVQGMNPALTLPGQQAVVRGLSRGDVYVAVHETHFTETTDYADVVLPAPTFLEKRDIVISDSHPYTRLAERAVEPLGEAREEVWVTRQIAERLRLGEGWLYEDAWEALGRALDGAFVDGGYPDLFKGRSLILRCRPREEYQTPSGRIEFYSSRAENEGLSPLPMQGALDRTKDEFVMLNSAVPGYTHSQFRDVYGPIPLVVWMSPADGEALGLKDGSRAILFNDSGELEVEILATDKVPRRTLWAPRPLKDRLGRTQNALVPPLTQRIGGGPFFNSTRVRVKASS